MKKTNNYIYIHRTIENKNVFYVGKGKGHRAYETRKGRHSDLWESFALNKYEIEIIECDLNEDDAFTLEVIYIAKYKSLGMAQANVTIGGRGINVDKRWWNDKISKALKGKQMPKGNLSKSYKDKITKDQLIHYYLQRKLSTIEIGKIFGLSYGTIIERLNYYNIKIRNTGRKSIMIKCVNDNKEFKSLSDAAKYYNVYRENIAKVISGKYKQTGGKKFIKI